MKDKPEVLPERDIKEDHPEIVPKITPGRAYEVPKGTRDAKWRSITSHKDGGYWVVPGVCKFGECLNPDCRFKK